MSEIDFTPFVKKYSGLWIALNKELNKVVAQNKSAERTYRMAVNKGCKKPTLFKVPKRITAYFGDFLRPASANPV